MLNLTAQPTRRTGSWTRCATRWTGRGGPCPPRRAPTAPPPCAGAWWATRTTARAPAASTPRSSRATSAAAPSSSRASPGNHGVTLEKGLCVVAGNRFSKFWRIFHSGINKQNIRLQVVYNPLLSFKYNPVGFSYEVKLKDSYHDKKVQYSQRVLTA